MKKWCKNGLKYMDILAKNCVKTKLMLTIRDFFRFLQYGSFLYSILKKSFHV